MGDGTLVSRGRRRFVKVASSLEISLVYGYSSKMNSLLSMALLLGKVKRLHPDFGAHSQHLLCWVSSRSQFSPQSFA